MTEVNVQIYKSEDEDVIEKMIFEDYNYEIKIERWQKILVFILNILTGGLGTLILPFINKNRNYTVLIFAGIILGFFQLFHFLHFFSVLSGVKFVEDIYDSISNDQILETLFKDDLKNKNDDSIIGTLLELRKFDITDTIPQIERKKFLKYSLGLLSGMSYANSFLLL